MIKFDSEKVLLLQKLIIVSSGGTAGVRDFGLLDSALQNAFQTFDGKELYQTKEEKGAKIGYSLVTNHAFVDGNKRIGMLVMLSFLDINGVHLNCTDDDVIETGLNLAKGTMTYEELYNWILKHKI